MNHCFFILGAILISGSHGFFINDPCDIYPSFSQSDIPYDYNSVIDDEVPESCNDGKMAWSYPMGRVMIHFQNPSGAPTAICIRDWVGGQGFVISDVTGGARRPLGDISRDKYTCTSRSRSNDLVLQIEAPKPPLYMGGVSYLVQRHA